jgi:Insertion element 4 transposase N-terminal
MSSRTNGYLLRPINLKIRIGKFEMMFSLPTALELIMSEGAIEEEIAETNSQEKRNRLFPTHLIIALIIALSLWSKDSLVDVLKNLVQGLSTS